MQCKYYTENGNYFKLANIYFEIGELFETNNYIDDAMNYYKSAFDLYETENIQCSTTKYFYKLANLYVIKKDYKTCGEFLEKSIKIDVKRELTRLISCKQTLFVMFFNEW